MDRLAEASKLLAGIDTAAVAQLTGSPEWSANVALSEGQIAFRRGDYAAARKYLEAARQGLSRADTEEYQKKTLADLEAALKGKP
jgi:hypothetical protein